MRCAFKGCLNYRDCGQFKFWDDSFQAAAVWRTLLRVWLCESSAIVANQTQPSTALATSV